MPLISYCVPVMNRTQDIQETLETNLAILEKYNNMTEIIINCFDDDSELYDWVTEKFKKHIDSGLLRFNRLPTLEYWHFCLAKNSFKDYMFGRYYASLDGDNFLSADEVSSTIELLKKNTNYLIHLFSGKWGDGTSGRIILPKELYIKHGYIDELFPRQFDEMALMLSVLESENITFCSRVGVDIFKLSGYAKSFKELSLRGDIRYIEYDFGKITPPLLPRGDGYAHKDERLNFYQNINAYYAMSKITRNENASAHYDSELKKNQNKLLESDKKTEFENIIFRKVRADIKKNDDLTVYSVIKNDFQYLSEWYQHYKSLGVKRFIIIDNDSDECISKKLPYKDVYVFKPKVGDFKRFKVFWINYLASLYQSENSWIITVDSDELVDLLSSGRENFDTLIDELNKSNIDLCSGVLIEMLPEEMICTDSDFSKKMTHHLWREPNANFKYQDIPSIKWAFGESWEKSFCLDFRYRFYGTIDCLRKFPLLKFNKTIRFNQGFHSLFIDGKQVTSEHFTKKSTIKLPIKHYKFQKLLSEDQYKKLKSTDISGYFGRTKDNISHIIDADKNNTIDIFFKSFHKKKYNGRLVFDFLNK